MQLQSARTGLAFFVGSAFIPIVVVSLVPIDFIKGQLHVPHWEGISVIALALALISMVSAVLFLACLKLDHVVPRAWVSVSLGLLSTAAATAIAIQTGNDFFFFVFHFGLAIGAGLLLQRSQNSSELP